ncbi:hypothetical protein ATCC90586_001587 [Pythium insidiosum]|nr:hypothetical protein ATCC90586_001587 [Pythium insidiosum]
MTDGKRAELSHASGDDDVTASYQHLRAKFVRSHDGPSPSPPASASSSASPAPSSHDAHDAVIAAAVNETSGVAELCQYIHQLELERRDLQAQVQFLRDQDATHKLQLSASTKRIEKLDAALRHALDAADTQYETRTQWDAAVAKERGLAVQATERADALQRQLDETEKARQHAVFQLSELQTAMAEAGAQRMLSSSFARPRTYSSSSGSSNSNGSSAAVDPTTGSNERIEKLKREVELLRQKLELRDAQANEKQKLAVELALRSAHLEHTAMLEKVRLECEIKLSEWRHDEAVRAKEIEAAMEEDRYSIRLEMRHGMQRAQIEQRVYYLQAQAALAQQQQQHETDAGSTEAGATPFGAMDEVLVRMQLELLRTRRFAALKKLLLIRQSRVDRALRAAVARWKSFATLVRSCQLHAVLHMHRLVRHLETRRTLRALHEWKAATRLHQLQAMQSQTLACWNRLLAVERLSHVLRSRWATRLTQSLHRWWLVTLERRLEAAKKSTNVVAAPADPVAAASRSRLPQQLHPCET